MIPIRGREETGVVVKRPFLAPRAGHKNDR